MRAPQHVVIGPEQHGVVEYALRLCKELGVEPLRFESAEALEKVLPLQLPSGVHICFTDHLWGESPEVAVDMVAKLAQGTPLSVSFHDVPQPQEGEERFEKRSAAYRRLGQLADVVSVNSEHEAIFFRENCPNVQPAVISLPLPVPVLSVDERAELSGWQGRAGGECARSQIAVMGFLYPGKGHRELIESLAGTGASITALGGVSAGHDDLVDQLNEAAQGSGVDFLITGFLPEEELERHMLATEIPVCAHRHFSASGSLMKWLSLGRRVLVVDTPYSRELAQRWEGLIVLVEDDQWKQAIDNLSADFSRAVEPPTDWTWANVADSYRAQWAESLG